MKGGETFSEFKHQFYSKTPDLSVFNCMEFNLLKVVLDGLKIDYASKGQMPDYVFKKSFLFYHNLNKLRFKSSQKKLDQNLLDKETLLLDVGRVKLDEKGKVVSTYFHTLKEYFPKNEFVFSSEVRLSENMDYDFVFSEVNLHYGFSSLSKSDLMLVKALRYKLEELRLLNIFNTHEQLNIKYAFHKFFYEYKAWNELFKKANFKKIFFICHYHKEGFLLATKRNKIKTIELQHGIIAKSDIFYDYPESIEDVRHKSLFGDEILSYGKYWSEVIEEGNAYGKDNINVLGFSMYERLQPTNEEKQLLESIIDHKKVILISGQTYLTPYFVEYAQFLSGEINEKEYVVIIKPHPAEDKKPYDVFINNENVHVVDIELAILFQYTNFHISIYSTTLFDALRFGNIYNYCLYIKKYEDYINEIVDKGVAIKLRSDEVPKEYEISLEVNSEYYYSKLKKEVLC